MSAALWFAAWEWINIAIEYTASAWVRLPRWFLAVVAVNLATHPAFTVTLPAFGRSVPLVVGCEILIAALEASMLACIYGIGELRRTVPAALLMNAASFATGILAF